jgi:hypothetical protein
MMLRCVVIARQYYMNGPVCIAWSNKKAAINGGLSFARA